MVPRSVLRLYYVPHCLSAHDEFIGGWLQVGDASVDPNMDPTELISSTGAGLQCIFIASAYRLSALGFLASAELAAEAASLGEENVWGNYGLWDQRLALEWVHENVGKWFGGNTREKLTLAGRSAGAYSVHAQVCHEFFMRKSQQKESAPMFNRLIMYGIVHPFSLTPFVRLGHFVLLMTGHLCRR